MTSTPDIDSAQREAESHGLPAWAQWIRRFSPLFAIIIFAAACWLLDRNLQSYQFDEIRHQLRQVPRLKVYGALALTALNYLCLAVVDWLAFKGAGVELPTRKIAAASLISYAASYNFGALLGGASMRYRLYSSWGLNGAEILKVVSLLAIASWVGLMTVTSAAFLAAPADRSGRFGVGAPTLHAIGALAAALVVAYLAATVVRRQPVRLGNYSLHLPGFSIALAQVVVSVVDLTLAAGALWTLLPDNLEIPFSVLLAGYMLAVFATILSHTPGGLGVFEVVVLTYVVPGKSPAAVGALVLFRLIYYLTPLAVAAICYTVFEWRKNRAQLRQAAAGASRWIAPVVPRLLALLVFLCGVVLLFSGAIPGKPVRLERLAEWLPLHLSETGHFVGSIVGTMLLVLAHGLSRRYDSAWFASMVLVSVGIVASLTKGFDWEEAAVLTVVLALLAISRPRFYRRGALLHSRLSVRWWTAILLGIAASLWLGAFAYKEVAYSHDLWWSFAYDADAPRFLRASLVSVTTLLILALLSLQGRPRHAPAPPTEEDIAHAARVIAAQSSTEAHLALMGDKSLLWNDARTAFVMYAVRDASWIALGDPVGPADEHVDLVWRFHELADSYGGRTVFHHVPGASLPTYLQLGLTPLKIGDAADVALESFSLDGPKHKSLRQVRNRYDRDGFEFQVVPAERVAALLPQLRGISDDWLAEKNTAEKRFSLGFFSEPYLCRTPVALVTKNSEVFAFANMLVTDTREELSIDLMRHGREVPNGIMDYLFAHLMMWGKEQGYRWFSLGMSPLSGLDKHPLAPLWNKIGNVLFEHGEHFYNYEGLRQYKQKFEPEWRPMYLCYPGGISLPRVLIDFAALNSGGVRRIVAKS